MSEEREDDVNVDADPPGPDAPGEPKEPRRDPVMRAAIRGVALTGLALTLGALLFFDARTAGGVGTGAVIATLNLMVFARIGEALILGRGATAPWAAIAMIKLAGLLGLVWMILRAGWFPPISIAVGFGSLPLGITLGTLFGPKPDSK